MSYAPVSALLKGLKVLEAVNRLGPASLRDITDATGLPKASTLRLLGTLQYAGYVSVLSEARRYIVTARVMSLSNNFQSDEALLAVARPVMKALREKTGWPSDLAICQHGKMVIADTDREPGAFSLNRKVGSRVPMTTTSLGKVYLALCSNQEREHIFSHLEAVDDPDEEKSMTREKFKDLAKKIREQGYATSDQEKGKAIRAVGVPVMQEGRVICAFNVIVPAQVISLAKLEMDYVPLVKAAARKIEALNHG